MSSQDLQSAPLMWSAMFAGPCEGVVLPPVSVRQTTVVCCNKSHSCPAKQLFIKRRGYLKHTHTRTHTTIPPASRQVQRWTEDLPAALLSLLPRFNMGSLGVLLFLAVSAVTVKGKLSARALIANWLPRLDRRVWLGRRGISCVWSISRTVCGSSSGSMWKWTDRPVVPKADFSFTLSPLRAGLNHLWLRWYMYMWTNMKHQTGGSCFSSPEPLLSCWTHVVHSCSGSRQNPQTSTSTTFFNQIRGLMKAGKVNDSFLFLQI